MDIIQSDKSVQTEFILYSSSVRIYIYVSRGDVLLDVQCSLNSTRVYAVEFGRTQYSADNRPYTVYKVYIIYME